MSHVLVSGASGCKWQDHSWYFACGRRGCQKGADGELGEMNHRGAYNHAEKILTRSF